MTVSHFLLVMLPTLLLEKPPGEALYHWLTVVLLGEVLLSIGGGVLFGYLVGRILAWLYEKGYGHNRSLLAVSLAMAVSSAWFSQAVAWRWYFVRFCRRTGLQLDYP